MPEPQGKKEVVEAVAIAALTALATGLIEWGIEALKAYEKRRIRNKRRQRRRDQKDEDKPA